VGWPEGSGAVASSAASTSRRPLAVTLPVSAATGVALSTSIVVTCQGVSAG
jgi:hypothetical protein